MGKMEKYSHDIKILKAYLPSIPKFWDGQTSVLELKEADYNWRQMEWWAFYFEYQVKKTLPNVFTFPGDAFKNICFDMKGQINWDLKAKFLNGEEYLFLNNKEMIERTIQETGYYGVITAFLYYDYKKGNAWVESIYSFVVGKGDLKKLDLFSAYREKTAQYAMNVDNISWFKEYKLEA
jgi:hypothetical protein